MSELVPSFVVLPALELKEALDFMENIEIFPEQSGKIQKVIFKETKENKCWYICYFKKIMSNVLFNKKISSASNKLWNIWSIMPIGKSNNLYELKIESYWKTGIDVFDRLAKENPLFVTNIPSYEQYFLGPYTAKQLYEQDPFLLDLLFYNITEIKRDKNGNVIEYVKDLNSFKMPWVIFGMGEPEKIAKIEYNPTKEQLNNNITIDKETIFPKIPMTGSIVSGSLNIVNTSSTEATKLSRSTMAITIKTEQYKESKKEKIFEIIGISLASLLLTATLVVFTLTMTKIMF